jgi:hypothetical protein
MVVKELITDELVAQLVRLRREVREMSDQHKAIDRKLNAILKTIWRSRSRPPDAPHALGNSQAIDDNRALRGAS